MTSIVTVADNFEDLIRKRGISMDQVEETFELGDTIRITENDTHHIKYKDTVIVFDNKIDQIVSAYVQK
jgi:hypothetical protein